MSGNILGILTAISLTIVVPMVVNECSEISPWLAERMLRWGARRLGTPEKVERYTEEWLADLDAVPGKLTKLGHACGVTILGIAQLRTRPPRLSWQPRPMIIPFTTDSVFGPANSEIAVLDRSISSKPASSTTADLAGRRLVPPPHRNTHQCDGSCTLECFVSDGRLVAPPVIGVTEEEHPGPISPHRRRFLRYWWTNR